MQAHQTYESPSYFLEVLYPFQFDMAQMCKSNRHSKVLGKLCNSFLAAKTIKSFHTSLMYVTDVE